MNNILLALSKHRISYEIQRHLKEDNRSGIILEDGVEISFKDISVIVIDDLQSEKNKNILSALKESNENHEIIIVAYAKDRDYIVGLSRECNVFRILPANWTPLGVRYAVYHALLRSKIKRVAREFEISNKSRRTELGLLKEELGQKLQVESGTMEEFKSEINELNGKIKYVEQGLEATFAKVRYTVGSKSEDFLFNLITRELGSPIRRIMQLSDKILRGFENDDPRIDDILAMMKKTGELLKILGSLKNANSRCRELSL